MSTIEPYGKIFAQFYMLLPNQLFVAVKGRKSDWYPSSCCTSRKHPRIITYSRGATTLLINRTSGKCLIVDSTSANGPLFRIPFLTSTGWCEKYFLYVFSLFATKKRRKSSSFFQKISILIFSTVTHHNIYPN